MDAPAPRPHGSRVFIALVGILIGFGMGAGWATFAEEASDRSSTSTLPRHSATTAAAKTSSGQDSQVDHKLDQLLAGQQAILKQFDAVLEELQVIKVRCTR